jgi:septal ring factor EnvC (AmiA/AmiB activator)
MIAFAILALVPLAAGVESHPIEKVINLLKKLKDQAIEEGKTEEVSFAKFKYWCSTSISEVSKAIEEEKANIDELESAIKGFKEDKKALEDQIDELEDQIKDLEAEAKAAKEADEKRNKAYIADKKRSQGHHQGHG